MKRTLVLGDTHGRIIWEKIIADNPDVDKIVFIGDYFDSREKISAADQICNFNKIVQFKRDNLEKVILLEGNHDSPLYVHGGMCSGYQSGAAPEIIKSLLNAKDVLQIAYNDRRLLFTHAGVSKTWLRGVKYDFKEPIDQFLNKLYLIKPKHFEFTIGPNEDDTGDDITQTPIWIRPNSLISDFPEQWIQIVGHTHASHVRLFNNLALVDALPNEYLLIEEDNNEYEFKRSVINESLH